MAEGAEALSAPTSLRISGREILKVPVVREGGSILVHFRIDDVRPLIGAE